MVRRLPGEVRRGGGRKVSQIRCNLSFAFFFLSLSLSLSFFLRFACRYNLRFKNADFLSEPGVQIHGWLLYNTQGNSQGEGMHSEPCCLDLGRWIMEKEEEKKLGVAFALLAWTARWLMYYCC